MFQQATAITEMQQPGLPADEASRLAALQCSGLLDSAPSESFDRITWLAAEILDVPIVLVSLVDENRQWFKSRIGIDARETTREVSFCAHAVCNRELLNIPDATRDPRFVGNPLVTGAPHIRAYVGVPLFSRQGHAFGTLCAIDTRPRSFFERHLKALTHLARILEDTIHAGELEAAANGRDRGRDHPGSTSG
jgi:GAF domain-containing protein